MTNSTEALAGSWGSLFRRRHLHLHGERIDIETVNGATLAIYLAATVPTALGLFFITRFTRLVMPRHA